MLRRHLEHLRTTEQTAEYGVTGIEVIDEPVGVMNEPVEVTVDLN